MSSSSPSQQTPVSCKLVHHGAAASSSPHVLVWLPSLPPVRPDSQIVYASHGIVNICEKQTVAFGNNQKESVWSVSQTLRTSMPTADANKRVITSLAHVGGESLVCGFSNGSINLWSSDVSSGEWKELPIVVTETGRSITHVDGHYFDSSKRYILFTCSSEGTNMIQVSENSEPIVTQVSTHAARVINCQYMPAFDQVLVLIGTAAPRHNKIHVYLLDSNIKLHHVGSLTGHEDWITCLAWNSTQTTLASGSQDAKIRLWQFTTTTTTNSSSTDNDNMAIVSDNDDSDTSDDDENFDNDDDDEEGEARLELVHFNNKTTRVTLEALLFGHEEAVTAICWHPDPMPLYRQEEILISSSMDRTILIWSPVTGVWTPLTRVGSAGGILGGSIGSSLLGFVNVVVEPLHGTSLIGHAYGGALHVWNVQQDDDSLEEEESVEDVAMHCKWKAAPCITGHFEGVTDLCWEAERGDYLLTVSDDQTCRLWAPVSNEETEEQVWVELARPQVHGYDLTAVTSVSTPEHGHLYVSGADEKEARVFDAPLSSLRLLRAIYGDQLSVGGDGTSRVERAYIPSLGLSQKASAADRAEMDTNETDVVTIKEEESQLRLPLERDLGVVSLWPEVRKLFGHNTELFCLASTVSARSGPKFTSSPFARQVLVASSTKARDIDAAAIRLWDAEKGKCIQVLSGGHRSTVAALAFSPDGRYLASSGKDRRLCLWARTDNGTEPLFTLGSAVDSAHKRIVWGLHFCPFDPSLLVSGSRDGCVKLWKVSNAEETLLTEVSSYEPSTRKGSKAESITSLAFAPRSFLFENDDSAILALGLECGFVELWAVPTSDFEAKTCQLLLCLPPAYSHIATVSKIAWRPLREGEEDTNKLTLATCSADRGCRLFEFEF